MNKAWPSSNGPWGRSFLEEKETEDSKMATSLKVVLIIISGLALFAGGYLWGAKVKEKETAVASGTMNTAGMEGMGSMQGMPGMTPGMAMVSQEKQQLLGIKTAVIERRALAQTVRTVGNVTYDETRLTHVHSKIEGWVEKLYVNYTGKLVKKGQPLFTLYSPELLATQQEYLLALKARERLAASSIPEVRSGAASLVEASKRRLSLWDISEDQIHEIEKTGDFKRALTLYAPNSGFVIKKDINEGMKVMPDKELYTIADLSTLWVNVDIYESEIPLIRLRQAASLTLSYDPTQVFSGKVSYIYPYLDEKTRTLKVRLEFPNPDFKLKPDMYVNAEIKVDAGKHLAVPEEAVLDSGMRKIVFVDKGMGHFEPKEVKLGSKMDGYYRVLSGLSEGERVAASSAFLLDSESRLSEAMGAMAGMPGMSMPGMAGMQGMEGMKDMKMDAPTKAGPQEKKVQDLTLTLSTQPEKPKAGENMLRLKITDKAGNPVKEAQVSFQYTMNMPGMVLSKADAKLSKDGFYESKANMGMTGEWDVTVMVRRPGQKDIQEKFKVVAVQ
jgi:Cu(I)/Ag(I) efflux system membrane fusion protein